MKVFSIAEDGLPEIDKDNLTGRVAFITNGCIVSGWPVDQENPGKWETHSNVGRATFHEGVEKYVVFDVPVWDL